MGRKGKKKNKGEDDKSDTSSQSGSQQQQPGQRQQQQGDQQQQSGHPQQQQEGGPQQQSGHRQQQGGAQQQQKQKGGQQQQHGQQHQGGPQQQRGQPQQQQPRGPQQQSGQTQQQQQGGPQQQQGGPQQQRGQQLQGGPQQQRGQQQQGGPQQQRGHPQRWQQGGPQQQRGRAQQQQQQALPHPGMQPAAPPQQQQRQAWPRPGMQPAAPPQQQQQQGQPHLGMQPAAPPQQQQQQAWPHPGMQPAAPPQQQQQQGQPHPGMQPAALPQQQQQQGQPRPGMQPAAPPQQQQQQALPHPGMQPAAPPQQQQRQAWPRPGMQPAAPPQQQQQQGQPHPGMQPAAPPQQQQQQAWPHPGMQPAAPPQQQQQQGQPHPGMQPAALPQQQQQQGQPRPGMQPAAPPQQQQQQALPHPGMQPAAPPQQQQRQAWLRPGMQPAAPPQQPAILPQQQAIPPQQQKQQGQPHPGMQAAGRPQQPGPSQQHVKAAEQPAFQGTSVAIVRKSGKAILPTNLQQMYLDQIPRKASPNGGTLGRRITVETNMLRLNFAKDFETDVVHYDVVITPDKPKFLFRTIFEEYRKKHFPRRYPAFDGKQNAYSAKELPFGDISKEDDVTIYDTEFAKERTFRVYLKKAAILDLSWLKNFTKTFNEGEREQKCVHALEIILRNGPSYHNVTVGRSLFPAPEPGRVVKLSGGLDLWVGVFQSVVVGSRPYLNIDVAHKGFPAPQSVIDLMKELCRNPRDRSEQQDISPAIVDRNRDKITKFLKGLKVQYEIPQQHTTKRTYRVNGLAPCARNDTFTLDDKTKCTVEQYFLQNKRYKIRYPDLPCLWVGSQNSSIHLPAELCTVVAGQATQKKLDENQTANMVRAAATNTRTRKEKIMQGFAKMDLNRQPTLMNEFRLSVQGEFEKVPARVLEPPVLQYNEGSVTVSKGTWRAKKFLSACDLPENSWTILNLDSYVRDRDLYDLHDSLQRGGHNLRMQISKARTPFTNLTIRGSNITEINRFFGEKKEQNTRLVVVILPPIDSAYSVVKQISELSIPGGIVTQCLKSQTLRKLSEATIANILLKINSKLNGINHSFAPTHRPPCLQVPCMIVGADVTHPSPDATDIPSIAAVVASHDPKAFQYNIETRLQPPREEIILDLEEIMIIQLKYFFQKTGHKPMRLIFYRDGVSEGQLPQVMHFELSAIKKAIARLEGGSTERKLAITFLVVQKRHHIRLFPTDSRNSDDRNFNVQAGTIVDTEITHPTHIDFYLVSHASIQGTARPTKYRCLCNENQMSENEIEQLTYYLCHLFARCTRSVSYPAPTYYAHLAAFRARALIHNVSLNLHNLQEEQRKKMNLQINKNSPMFFV